MTLYIIKRKDYKLYPQNCFAEVYDNSKYLIGIVAFIRKKDAINYMRQLKEKTNYDFEYEIIKAEVKK